MQNAQDAREGFRLTVIGGGAAGVETALAAAYRARTTRSELHVQLLTGGVPLLPGHGDRARSLVNAALEKGGVQVVDAIAHRIDADAVITGDRGGLPPMQRCSPPALRPPDWLRDTQLALDDRGFIAVNSHLQSISHPFVFAAGDVATLTETPRPKSGVYAVRAAGPLANNLIAATGKSLCVHLHRREERCT